MNRERRAVLRGVAALTGVAVGGPAAVGSGAAASTNGPTAVQQVEASFSPGVTLFDLNDDGTYAATVESASSEMQDDDHPAPIHVTSGGNSTVDYAASVLAPPDGTTLGGLDRLDYDYYEGANNVNPDDSGGGFAPDETFLVVENDDGRHGTYLTYNDGSSPAEEWRTFDVLARMQGETGGTSQWFEYTSIEEGYDQKTFGNVVERFGADATLALVGVGHGNAVDPATLDLYYDTLRINDETLRFPSSVVERVASERPA